jgi:hypothetical protein
MKPATTGAKLRVLLVEDSPGDARLLREYLADVAQAPFELEDVDTLEAGLERLRKGGIGLVLLDLSLPDCFGLETFTRTRDAAPDVPIIVLSGRDDEALAIQTVHEGAQDYLVKSQVDRWLLVRSMRYAIERKRAEEALAKERDLLHTLLNNLPDRIYFKDRKSRFLRISRAVMEQFKITDPKVALGRTDFDFFAPEHAQVAFRDEQEIMQSGQPIIGKIERETLPDGSVTWALTSKLPLKDKRGRIVGNFGISRDITDLKKIELELARSKEELQKALAELQKSHEELKAAQFQLIQAEKLQSVGRLAAGVAHEVKNPLGILGMGIDYLTKNLVTSDPNVAQILNDMKEALHRADAIIMGLLDFSVPRELAMRNEDLNAILEQTLGMVKHEMSAAPVRLGKELAPDLPPVWVDSNKMKQVFVNILTNAIHAMPGGGTLTIRTLARQLQETEVSPDAGSRIADRFRAGDRVVVCEVVDTGSGISEEKLAHIFDPFFTTKPTGKGTGLGLTVTKQIVERHGGTIDIRNRKEGGVIVTVMLKV